MRHLNKHIPAKVIDRNIILGTWNIRELSPGIRGDESYGLIAEVVSRYDIIAIQELKTSIEPLERIKEHLGSHWRYIVSHPCLSSKGSGERMAFLYDTRRVEFSGISSFIGHYGQQGKVSLNQFSRAPFMAGFSAGGFDFFLCNVHLYYDSGNLQSEFRREEIQNLLERFEMPKMREKYGFSDNFIILGDFNIPTKDSSSYSEINAHGYQGYEQFLQHGSEKKKLYDQIIFQSNSQYLKEANHGRLKVFDYVYTQKERDYYQRYYSFGKMNYETWRTYQMSDHEPLWLELSISATKERWCSRIKNGLALKVEGDSTSSLEEGCEIKISQDVPLSSSESDESIGELLCSESFSSESQTPLKPPSEKDVATSSKLAPAESLTPSQISATQTKGKSLFFSPSSKEATRKENEPFYKDIEGLTKVKERQKSFPIPKRIRSKSPESASIRRSKRIRQMFH